MEVKTTPFTYGINVNAFFVGRVEFGITYAYSQYYLTEGEAKKRLSELSKYKSVAARCEVLTARIDILNLPFEVRSKFTREDLERFRQEQN